MPTPSPRFDLPPNLPYIEPQWNFELLHDQPTPAPLVQGGMAQGMMPQRVVTGAVMPSGYGSGVRHGVGYSNMNNGANACVGPYAPVNAIYAMPGHQNGQKGMNNGEAAYAWPPGSPHTAHNLQTQGYQR